MAIGNARPTVLWTLAASALFLSACSGKQEARPAAPPADAKRVDETKAGNVTGRVVLNGTAPANAQIKMGSDPVCMSNSKGPTTWETFVVDNGGLENVFVYVKDGLGGYYFDAPTEPVKLEQTGCRYHPHVFGIRVGQPLEIVNSDDTMHNVHAVANVNQEFNFGQPMKGMRQTKTFTTREVMVPVKCDVHNWMMAYAGIVEHPYFAITANGGTFELKNVPAGTYTIEAWHEKLGTQSQTVTLGEKESKAITFTFQAPAG
jgi:plastocyanin